MSQHRMETTVLGQHLICFKGSVTELILLILMYICRKRERRIKECMYSLNSSSIPFPYSSSYLFLSVSIQFSNKYTHGYTDYYHEVCMADRFTANSAFFLLMVAHLFRTTPVTCIPCLLLVDQKGRAVGSQGSSCCKIIARAGADKLKELM